MMHLLNMGFIHLWKKNIRFRNIKIILSEKRQLLSNLFINLHLHYLIGKFEQK